jgi:1,4-dihydroxy-2-naphthoate octaprenyltransferase
MLVWLNLIALGLSLGSFVAGRQPIGAVMAGIGLGMAIVLLAFDEKTKRKVRP